MRKPQEDSSPIICTYVTPIHARYDCLRFITKSVTPVRPTVPATYLCTQSCSVRRANPPNHARYIRYICYTQSHRLQPPTPCESKSNDQGDGSVLDILPHTCKQKQSSHADTFPTHRALHPRLTPANPWLTPTDLLAS